MSPAAEASDEAHNIEASQNRVAAQIEGLLEHYKQEDPVGVPGAPIPDPMDVPDMAKSLGMANLNMLKVKAYGLSKFRIATVDMDFKQMRASSSRIGSISSNPRHLVYSRQTLAYS